MKEQQLFLQQLFRRRVIFSEKCKLYDKSYSNYILFLQLFFTMGPCQSILEPENHSLSPIFNKNDKPQTQIYPLKFRRQLKMNKNKQRGNLKENQRQFDLNREGMQSPWQKYLLRESRRREQMESETVLQGLSESSQEQGNSSKKKKSSVFMESSGQSVRDSQNSVYSDYPQVQQILSASSQNIPSSSSSFTKRYSEKQNVCKDEEIANSVQEIKQYLFRNHFNLVKYLSENRKEFFYIAQHHLPRQYKTLKNSYFRIEIQRGIKEVEEKKKDEENQVLKRIIMIIRGIIELQKIGIYHADLCVRNTIKVSNNRTHDKKEFQYKIIDFDYAFYVNKHAGENQMLSSTKKILKFAMTQKHSVKEMIFKYLFKGIRQIDHILSMTTVENAEDQNEILDRIVEEFYVHSLRSHKDQFYHLVKNEIKYLLEFNYVQDILETIEIISTQNLHQNTKGYEGVISYLQRRFFT